MDDFGNRHRKSGGIVFGLMLVLLGVVLILQNVGRIAILADGRQLPVSRAGYKRLSSLLAE